METTKLMTKKIENQGNKYISHNKQANIFIQQNHKSMRNSIIQTYGSINHSQYAQYSHKNQFINQQQSKPYRSIKAKNVGSNVFGGEYCCESIYVVKPYSKMESHKYSSEKNTRNLSACSTVPSEEELTQSSLHGFKVIQNGKIIHNEAVSENNYDIKYLPEKFIECKFAASMYTIEPSSKEIQMPGFIDDDDDDDDDEEEDNIE